MIDVIFDVITDTSKQFRAWMDITVWTIINSIQTLAFSHFVSYT